MGTRCVGLQLTTVTGLLLTACAGPPDRRADYDFGDVTTYAWRTPPRFASGTRDGEEGELLDFERRVQRMLERRGVELVDKPRAQVVLSGQLRIEERVQENDPNYSVYAAEKFEVAVMTLEVFDRKTRQLVWSDDEERRLRTVGRRFGRRLAEEFEDTGEERRWSIYDMVDALVTRIPR